MNYRFLLICTLFTITSFFAASFKGMAQNSGLDFYELKVYHIENQEQESRVDEFLQQAYIPALKRAGINKVGVFKPVEGDSAYGEKIYVYIPYTSAQQFLKVPELLEKDKKYLADGSGYLNAPHDNPPYERIETVLLQAFEGMPNYKSNNIKGEASDKVYELRSYEGATEKLYKNKVDMFNKG